MAVSDMRLLESLPDAPEFLDEIGKERWYALGHRLIEEGRLTSDMLETLESYCEAYSDFRGAVAELQTYGTTCYNEEGRAFAHPAVDRKNKAETRWRRAKSDLGLIGPARAPKRGKQSVSTRPSDLDM